ncbi:hypothetical protein FH972_004293 [Carpinus fangiana]|uniref:Uncharacterized protein n=1 Tax=Carpinus fangiana TaxID=176857 RepID=A0A5N6QMJ0_9ROSI|nr:hypothetical protein FH972_004293 [Carpinus fangiana]
MGELAHEELTEWTAAPKQAHYGRPGPKINGPNERGSQREELENIIRLGGDMHGNCLEGNGKLLMGQPGYLNSLKIWKRVDRTGDEENRQTASTTALLGKRKGETEIKTLLLSPASTSLPPPRSNSFNFTHGRALKLLGMAKESSDSDSGNAVVEKAAIADGLVSTPVIGWSLYTLKTTGCGLPPGPGGSIGAIEGVSYLVVVGIVAWSLYTKTKTGSGLPNGPFGLLGAVEGLSYLTLLAIVVVFGLQYFEQGYIPGPLPPDQCFG